MRNCAFCNKEFEAKTSRLCCTRTCSAKLSMDKKGKSAWTPQEISFLENNLGSLPFRSLITAFKQWAKKQGYPTRTTAAIDVQIHRMTTHSHLSRKCTEDNFTVYELARGLGVKMDRIRVFVRNGKLPRRKIARNQSAIKRKDAIALVLDNPSYFANCDRDNLFWLLENNKLVEKVKNAPQSTKGRSRAVRCYSAHGIKTYPSLRAAAKANFISHSCIFQAITTNGTSAGMKWEWV